MPLVKIDNLKPGMVLAAELKTPDGRVLLPAGAELTDNHIAQMKRQGVEEAQVRAVYSDEDLRRASGWVKNFFLYVNHEDPIMAKLYELAVQSTAGAMAEGFVPPEKDPRLEADNEHLADLFIRGEGGPVDMVDHEEKIASFPDVYFRLREVLKKPSASAKDIAKVVGADAGLSAKLLKLVNSPLYGFSSSVDSVDRAVALVGEKELTTLAVGISAVSYFKDIPPELVNMKVFWRHSLNCAVLAALLAAKISRRGGAEVAVEQCFTAGLLHDVGKLILFKKLPYASVMGLQYAQDHFYPLVEAERDVFGFDHGQVAEVLLSRWGLPRDLTEAVAKHHDPLAAQNQRRAAVIQLADNMANAMEIAAGGRFVLPGMSPGAFELLGMPPDHLDEVAIQGGIQVEEMASAFL